MEVVRKNIIKLRITPPQFYDMNILNYINLRQHFILNQDHVPKNKMMDTAMF